MPAHGSTPIGDLPLPGHRTAAPSAPAPAPRGGDALRVRDALHRGRVGRHALGHGADWLHHVARHFADAHAVRPPGRAGGDAQGPRPA